MRKSTYKYRSEDIEIVWDIIEFDDYYSIKEVNSIDGMNYISIPKRITKRIFRTEDS